MYLRMAMTAKYPIPALCRRSQKRTTQMATTTLIHVTKTDNELYIIAVPAGGIGSSEIGHIKSGFNNPVEYRVVPQSVLAPGSYTLVLVGINWGGPQQFSVTLTTGGVVQPPINFGAGTAVGASSAQVAITV
jgi:hypothetical protein